MKEKLQITYLPESEITPYVNNSRTHTPNQIEKLKSSINEFGMCSPIGIHNGTIVYGHARFQALKALGYSEFPTVDLSHLTTAQMKAYVIADNRLALDAGWDDELLSIELEQLQEMDFDLDSLGFNIEELDALLEPEEIPEGLTDEDEVPEPPPEPKTKKGDIWLLGDHRLMCGDSTDAECVARLMNGEKAQLIHADPPYGMGKEADGVANDNLYRDKLDAFQMAWWRTFRPHTADNGGAYIWGNAPDLWRLWYRGGLADSERLTMRNEIVWAKGDAGAGGISHQGAEGLRLFPQSTERCLFFMLGEQGFNNNADNYWEGWEPIRAYLEGERRAAGLTTAQCNEICGKQNMTQAAFTKGGFRLILREDYEKLKKAANGKAFKREYDDLKRDHDALKRDFYATRAYFDNTHDNMTDVWEFKRVTGEERHGHATPKPVDMIARCMKSSLPDGGLCAEPFSGSGTTIIAAEKTGRRCYAMELSPRYVDVAVMRWQDYTGKKAILESNGQEYDSLS